MNKTNKYKDVGNRELLHECQKTIVLRENLFYGKTMMFYSEEEIYKTVHEVKDIEAEILSRMIHRDIIKLKIK